MLTKKYSLILNGIIHKFTQIIFMKKLTLCFIALGFCFTLNAHTTKDFWGATGHRVVGKIADNHLSSKAKREVNRLLNRHTLAFTSTFADEIKSDKRYNKFYTWHYINMPLDSDYESSKKNPEGDLVTGINYCIQMIKDKKASDDDKAFYLKLLIHFIGDLHQPMHVGLEEDKGGNDFKVQWFYNDSNLHRVWDTQMIDEYGMSYTELADNADVLSKAQVKYIKQGSITDWANETHEITRNVYNTVTPDENLKYRYSYDNFKTVRTQLQKAGIRLAKVLNELF